MCIVIKAAIQAMDRVEEDVRNGKKERAGSNEVFEFAARAEVNTSSSLYLKQCIRASERQRHSQL